MSYRVFVQHAVPVVIALVKNYLHHGDDSPLSDGDPVDLPVADSESSTNDASIIVTERMVVLVSSDSDEA